MRRWCAIFFLIASLLLSGCGVSWSQQQPSPKWTTGFWFWQGSSARAEPSTGPVDVLFIEAGSIRKEEPPMYVLRQESQVPVRQREPQTPLGCLGKLAG
ncbi:MAG TPA: hypothetical protein VHB50_01780 [Bryobacteraceae bacterium]|nr:hypothetical protein [Bryobacteraceae bacterium]